MMQQAAISLGMKTSRFMGLTPDALLTIYCVQFPVMRQYEADTWYDQTGRIVLTPRKGLIGVGLPRKARKSDPKAGITYGTRPAAVGWGEERTASLAPAPPANGAVRSRSPHPTLTTSGIALGWEEVRDLPAGCTVNKTFPDDTLPGGPVQRTITYQPPFIRPDREQDCRIAWAFFTQDPEEQATP